MCMCIFPILFLFTILHHSCQWVDCCISFLLYQVLWSRSAVHITKSKRWYQQYSQYYYYVFNFTVVYCSSCTSKQARKMAFRVIKQRREARRNAKLEEIFQVRHFHIVISDHSKKCFNSRRGTKCRMRQ